MVHGTEGQTGGRTGLRLDKWLWFARLTKTRTAAQGLCESRRLRIDGRVIDRASALVRAGAVLSFPRGDEVIVVRVEGLASARGPYDEARQLYTDLSARATNWTPSLPLTSALASF